MPPAIIPLIAGAATIAGSVIQGRQEAKAAQQANETRKEISLPGRARVALTPEQERLQAQLGESFSNVLGSPTDPIEGILTGQKEMLANRLNVLGQNVGGNMQNQVPENAGSQLARVLGQQNTQNIFRG